MIREREFKSRKRSECEPVRILLLEDDPSFAELLRAQLRRMPLVESRLEVARSLSAALAKLDHDSFGLVIADLNLPDSSGVATIEALSGACELPIIVLTGAQEPELRARALASGAYDFLSKDSLSAAALERLVRLGAMQANTFRSLRESEARFRSLIELSSDFYWESDTRHRVVKIEHGSQRHPVVNPAQLGKARWDLPSTRPDAAGWAAHRTMMEGRLPFRDFEIARRDGDGVERWRSISGEPVFDPSGAFKGYRGIGRDITERKHAEEDLRRFRLAMDNSADMILLIDRSTMRHVDVNSTICRLLGYTREELLSMTPADILPVTNDELTKVYDELIKNPSQESGMKSHYRCKDGSLLPFESTRRVLRSGDQWIIAAISRDIRERIGSEHALRESEARFRSLTALSSDWYWEQDEEFRFTRVEGRNSAIAGRLIGKRRWEIDVITPTSCSWAQHRAMLEARQPFRDFEYSSVGDGGELQHVAISGGPVFDDAGRFTGYRGIGRDITARKRQEQLLGLEHTVTRFLAEAESAAMGIQAVLRAICATLGWECGRYFGWDEGAGVLVFRDSWSAPGDALDGFIAKSRALTYIPGTGLVGRVFESGQPLWVTDLANDRRVHAGIARDAGMHGAFLFAAISDAKPIGVLVFHSSKIREPDERLLQMVRMIGSQMGQFLRRKETETGLRKSEERFRSLTELSADWYWEQDEHFRFTTLSGPGAAAMSRDGDPNVYLGKARWEIPDLEPLHGDWTPHRAQLERRESFRDVLMRRRMHDETLRYMSVSGEPLFDANGCFRGYRGVATNVTERVCGEEELRRFRAAMDMSWDAIYLTDRATLRFLDANEAACRGVGYAREQLLGMGPQDLLRTPRAELEREYDAVIAEGDKGMRTETSYRTKDGRERWTELYRRALRAGESWIIVTISRDVTQRKLAEERQAAHLRRQERIARFGQSALGKRDPAELIDEAVQNVLEGLGADAVAYFEPGPDERSLVVRALVGLADGRAEAGAVVCCGGDPVLEVMKSGNRLLADGAGFSLGWAHPLRSHALIPVRGERGVRGVLCACYKSADAFAEEELNFVEAAASVLSTALQRIDSEGRLAYLAQFDPLTGLPNRALLADRFSQMIVQARRRQSSLGVLFVDLDEFKMVNDSLGHAAGDELLKEAAVRLQSTVRPGDTVARISGDEFAVVLADLARPEDAALVAQKIIDRLAAAAEIAGNEVFVTASIGIAAFPGDGGDAETLLGAADAAMYRAKQSGRNAYQFFTAEINQRTRARAQLGTELRRALERDEFVLYYQPKFGLEDRRPHGAEALLRWKHPERGLVSPAEFIPVLEETGLIAAVSEWVLRRACEDVKAWQVAGLAVGPVAVNLSARQFRQQDLDERIKSIVASAGVDPALIELEITESQLMTDPDHAIRVMRSLSDAGMRIAIDDFGTGYSSLSYLTRFPVGSLKIDRSFVADVYEDPSDAAIVRTIIEMAHILGFTVIAEGVETEDQAKFLRLLRCEQAQGYLFARPMPAADLAKLFAS